VPKLIEFIARLFFPSDGRYRAEAVPAPPVPRPLPTPLLPHAGPLRGEDVAIVRPYLIAFERQREAQRGRERRTALVLATQGIDYDFRAGAA